ESQKFVVYLVIGGFPLTLILAWLAPSFKQGGAYYRRATGFVGVGMVIALVAFAGRSRLFPHEGISAAGLRSIGVLPFVDMSENHTQGYIADGISEEILNRLAQIEDLRVPARTSS